MDHHHGPGSAAGNNFLIGAMRCPEYAAATERHDLEGLGTIMLNLLTAAAQ